MAQLGRGLLSTPGSSRAALARLALSALATRATTLTLEGSLRALPSQDPSRSAFRARLARGDAVVKLAPVDDDADETRALLAALPGRVAPRLWAWAKTTELADRAPTANAARKLDGHALRVSVTAFVDGRALTELATLDDLELNGVARALVALHRADAPGRALPLPSEPARLLALARETVAETRRRRALAASEQRLVERALDRVTRTLKRRARERSARPIRRLCHGDLRAHNVVRTARRFRLIDFEHAGAGDPALDLALLSVRSRLDRFVELRLLDAYLAHSDDATLLRRYFTVLPVVRLLSALRETLDGRAPARARAERARVVAELAS